MNLQRAAREWSTSPVPVASLRQQWPRFANALDRGAPPITALRLCGLEYWLEGSNAEAARLLGAAAAASRDDPAILADLGCVERLLGKSGEAMRCFLDSLYLDNSQIEVWLNVAMLSVEVGDRDAAEEAYMQALELDADDREAAAGLGQLRLERLAGKAEERLPGLAVECGVGAAPVFACLGQTLYLLGKRRATDPKRSRSRGASATAVG